MSTANYIFFTHLNFVKQNLGGWKLLLNSRMLVKQN